MNNKFINLENTKKQLDQCKKNHKCYHKLQIIKQDIYLVVLIIIIDELENIKYIANKDMYEDLEEICKYLIKGYYVKNDEFIKTAIIRIYKLLDNYNNINNCKIKNCRKINDEIISYINKYCQ